MCGKRAKLSGEIVSRASSIVGVGMSMRAKANILFPGLLSLSLSALSLTMGACLPTDASTTAARVDRPWRGKALVCNLKRPFEGESETIYSLSRSFFSALSLSSQIPQTLSALFGADALFDVLRPYCTCKAARCMRNGLKLDDSREL